MPTYSLVVPAYNEEGVIEELVAHLGTVMDSLDGDAESILVDDGSSDRTWLLCRVHLALELVTPRTCERISCHASPVHRR